MNREIKFRGQTKGVIGEWICGYYIRWKSSHFILPEHFTGAFISSFKEVNRDTVGEYTGLKDKTEEAAELYEGDIIADLEGNKRYIEYSDGSFNACPVGKGYAVPLFELLENKDFIFKAGNIYENPK